MTTRAAKNVILYNIPNVRGSYSTFSFWWFTQELQTDIDGVFDSCFGSFPSLCLQFLTQSYYCVFHWDRDRPCILSTCVKCPGLTRRVEQQMYMSCTAIYHCSEASLITNEFHAIHAMWLHPRPEIWPMTSNDDDGYRAKNNRGKALTF
jgi:hypothetical protein